MSDTYEIDGVTVTPMPGGYYELKHASLSEPEKVRGQEAAATRAKEIAAAAVPADGSIPAQPSIEDVVPTTPSTDQVAALTALVEQQSAQIAALLAAQATTVTTEGSGSGQADPLAAVPREFSGQVSKEDRKAAAALGVEYVTIILEEGNDIPPTGLFLGHNGRSYMICPGEPVDVPDFLLNVLDDAIMASPVVDSKSQKILGYRNRMKYPYRRVNAG